MILGLIKVKINHYHQNQFLINNVDIDKILISNKVSFGKKGCKYFISFNNDDNKINPVCIMLPKRRRYQKRFGETNYGLCH